MHADCSAVREAAGGVLNGHWAGLSKLNSVRDIEVDVILGELGNRTAVAIYWPSAYRTLMLRYP